MRDRSSLPFWGSRIIELPVVQDARGNLAFVQSEIEVPFALRRVFYVYDVPGGSARAGHALRTCEQFVIAISGSFDVLLDDGRQRARFALNLASRGLYIAPGVWRELENFSSNAVCLVLASELYDPEDYIRTYPQFKDAVKARSLPGSVEAE